MSNLFPDMRNRDPEKTVAFGTAVACAVVLVGLVVAVLMVGAPDGYRVQGC